MQVHDRLAGSLTVVDANVIPVRGDLLVDSFFGFVQGREDGGLLDGFELKERLNVTFGDDEGVAV